jgi:Flp pilus assembly pilin Flp
MARFAFLTRLRQSIVSLRRDQRGTAAIEFAAVAVLMITIWLGCIAIVHGVDVHRKVTLAARTVADLATRFETLNNADKDGVLNAAKAIMVPNSDATLEVTLSAVDIDADGIAKVGWSEQLQGDGIGSPSPAAPSLRPPGCIKRANGSVVTLPGDVLKVPDSQLIWAEVCYLYKPIYVAFELAEILKEIKMYDQVFMSPRRSQAVVRIPK